MKFKRGIALFAAAVVAVSALTACKKDKEENITGKKQMLSGRENTQTVVLKDGAGSTLNVYFGTRPADFDPADFAYNSDEYRINSLIYEGLTGIDKDGKVYGVGAKEWVAETDSRTGELVLSILLQDTKWSNGKPVRAEDYIYSWRRMLEYSNTNPAASLLMSVKNAKKVKSGELMKEELGAVAVNDSIIEITFEDKNTDVDYFLRALASPMLVPLYMESAEHEDWSNEISLAVSNGPFVIKSISDERVMLDKNTFHRNSAVIYPQRIHIRFGDEQAAVGGFADASYHYVSELTGENASAFSGNTTSADALATYTYFFNTNSPMLSDVGTRKALSAAIDREEIALIRGDGAKAATGLVPVGVSEPDGGDFRSAGGNLIGSYTAAAEPLGISLAITYNSDRAYEEKIAEYIKAKWSEIGVSAKLVPVPGEEIPERIASGDFDVIAADYISFTNDAYGFLAPFAKEYSGSFVDVNSDVYFTPHFTGFQSGEYDSLIDGIATADNSKKTEIMHNAEKLLMEAAPVSPLYYEVTNHVIADNLKDVAIDYRGSALFTDARIAR